MFTANTRKDKEEMLKAAGVSSFDELIAQLPGKLRARGYNLPPALSEPELFAHIRELGAKNRKVLSFVGAGAYEHFIPSAVSQLASRGEFLTAYTPYQAEASQGTLQAIYEYQSSICALFDMEVSNASLYDGASALAEAVNAALRITSKSKILIPQALHPHYKKTLAAYFSSDKAARICQVPCPGGTMSAKEFDAALDDNTACAVVASPNFYGCIEDADAFAQKLHAKKALLVSVCDPVSLGALKTPGAYGADFAVAEGQGLGNPLNYGGPYLGIFTCRKEHIRHLPGRICGITKDKDGKRAFVLTLQAREQHIRREKAASNICSNEALCALRAAMHLALLGPQGVKEIAELNLEAAHSAADKLARIPGFSLKFGAPFFNEFVLRCPADAETILKRAAKEGVIPGLPLGNFDAGLKDCLLVCATETKTAADIDKLASILGGCSHA